MNNNDKYSEIYRVAQELRVNTEILRNKSRWLYMWSYGVDIIPFFIYIALCTILYYSDSFSLESNQVISLLVFFVLYSLFIFIQTRKYYYLSSHFHDVMARCGELSDMVDWESMRKRQVYKAIDEKIQFSIDDFYDYSMSSNCPFYGGRRRYFLLRLVSLIEVITVIMLSLLMTFHVIEF